MYSKNPTIIHRADLDNVPDQSTHFFYDEAVRLDVEVSRPSDFRRQGKNTEFTGKFSWASQGKLSIDQAESFAHAVLDGVERARQDAAKRNAAAGLKVPSVVQE